MKLTETIFPKLVLEEIARECEPSQVSETFSSYERLVKLNENYNSGLLEYIKNKLDLYLMETNIPKHFKLNLIRKSNYNLRELK